MLRRPSTYVVTKPRSRSNSPDDAASEVINHHDTIHKDENTVESNNPSVTNYNGKEPVETRTPMKKSSSPSRIPSSISSSSGPVQAMRGSTEPVPSRADLTDLIDEHQVFESPRTRKDMMVIIRSLIR